MLGDPRVVAVPLADKVVEALANQFGVPAGADILEKIVPNLVEMSQLVAKPRPLTEMVKALKELGQDVSTWGDAEETSESVSAGDFEL
jgi:hypothetical protein